MRAGDGDRDQIVSRLREAFAEGRLTNDEFNDRMVQANGAKTYGELAELVKDLPVDAPPAPAPPAVPAPAQLPDREDSHTVRNGWGAWLGVSVMVNVIYFATWLPSGGPAPYYWPIWVMGPWGAAMLIATLTRRD